MTTGINCGELRRLLLDSGFREVARPEQVVFRHQPSDTRFAFRPYRPNDPVASYNLIQVQDSLRNELRPHFLFHFSRAFACPPMALQTTVW